MRGVFKCPAARLGLAGQESSGGRAGEGWGRILSVSNIPSSGYARVSCPSPASHPRSLPAQVALGQLVVVSRQWDALAAECGLHQLQIDAFKLAGGNVSLSTAASHTDQALSPFLRPFRSPFTHDSGALTHAPNGAAPTGALPALPACAHIPEIACGRIHGVLFTPSSAPADPLTAHLPPAADPATACATAANAHALTGTEAGATAPAGSHAPTPAAPIRSGASAETGANGGPLRPRRGALGPDCIQVHSPADGSWRDLYGDTDVAGLLVHDNRGGDGRKRLKNGREIASSATLITAERFERFQSGGYGEHNGDGGAAAGSVFGGAGEDEPGFVGLKLECRCGGSKGEEYRVWMRLAMPPARLVHSAQCTCAYFKGQYSSGELRPTDEFVHLCKHQVGLLDRARRVSSQPRAPPPASAPPGQMDAGPSGVAHIGPAAAPPLVAAPPPAARATPPVAAASAAPGATPQPRGKRKLPQFGLDAGPARARGRGSGGAVPVVDLSVEPTGEASDTAAPPDGQAQMNGGGVGRTRSGRDRGRGAAGAGSGDGQSVEGAPLGPNAGHAGDGGEVVRPWRRIPIEEIYAVAQACLARARARGEYPARGQPGPSGGVPTENNPRTASASEQHPALGANGHGPTPAAGLPPGSDSLPSAPGAEAAGSIAPGPAGVAGAAVLGSVGGEEHAPAATGEGSSAPQPAPGGTEAPQVPLVSLAHLLGFPPPAVFGGPAAAASATPAAASSSDAAALDSSSAPMSAMEAFFAL